MKQLNYSLFLSSLIILSVTASDLVWSRENSRLSSGCNLHAGQDDQLVGLQSSIWKNLEIPVCWENPLSAHEQARRWVRDAVSQTWERNSALRFIGWEACTIDDNGIRIGVADVNPHTKGLGSQLDGMRNGMMLNFSFIAWSPACSRTLENCVRNIAVHEFGHALGFSHEANRDDAPDWCRAESQGTSGDVFITPYDLYSVMNYCNPKWGGDGKLSENDLAGLKAWYGEQSVTAGRFDGDWQGKLAYNDTGCVEDSVSLTVSGQKVTGTVKTPEGQVVNIIANLDENSCLDGFEFGLMYPNRPGFIDEISLKGQLTSGSLNSTDCGFGSYSFTRK